MASLEVKDPAEAGAGATGDGAVEKTDSFLKPVGEKGKAPPKEKSLHWAAELGLFAFFILTRAIHPTIIAASKVQLPSGKMGYAYASGTTVICMCATVVIGGMGMAVAQGEFMKIWDSKALRVFSINGIVYSVGDWLEMQSMGSLSGAAYQVLLQSKFIFTAILFIYVKNEHQTRLQWLLLISLMLSCSVYMAIASSGPSNTPFLGMFFALLKVIVSCLGAVISDKFMKDFKKTPIHIQLVQMGIARFVCSLGLSFIGTDIWGKGFFFGWTPVVCGVFISFVVKSVSTLYLVALLDSMLKNIGEALAIIVIYFWDQLAERLLCIAPGGCVSTPFDIPPLLAIIVVILFVASYLEAKDVVKKAKQYDEMKAKKAVQS
jgi:hypothetical protein